MGKTSVEVKERYNAKAYDRLYIRVKKGEKERIQAASDAAGESLNNFIVKAIEEYVDNKL